MYFSKCMQLMSAFMNTYYVVAHFHYVLPMRCSFCINLQVFIFGFRVITRTINCRNYRNEFILFLAFIGVNLTFFPIAFIRYGRNAHVEFLINPDTYASLNYIASYGFYSIFCRFNYFLFMVLAYHFQEIGRVLLN